MKWPASGTGTVPIVSAQFFVGKRWWTDLDAAAAVLARCATQMAAV